MYGKELTFAFTDEWLIFAKDKDGKLYYYNVELNPKWTEIDDYKNNSFEENSIQNYLMPLLNWDELYFSKVQN